MPFVVSPSNRERPPAVERSPFDKPVLSGVLPFDWLRANEVERLRANEGTCVTVITRRSTKRLPSTTGVNAVRILSVEFLASVRRSSSSAGLATGGSP